MKLKKKSFFKIHSWIGVRLSILFFIVCFSGTLATLSHELDWIFIPEIRAEQQGNEWAPRNLITDNFKKAYPYGQITFWLRTEEPYLCDILYKTEDGQRSYVFANPYNGKIQGEVHLTFQRFFRDLHYFLFIPFQIGHFTVLIFGFLLFISLVTALLFYKKWWRKLFVLQTGNGTLVFFRSLHRLIGLWSLPMTLLFSITGIWYFLERADVAEIGSISNPSPPKVSVNQPQEIHHINSLTLDYDKAVSRAESAITGLRVGDIHPSDRSDKALYLTGFSSVPLVRQRANRVYLDPGNYEILKVQNASETGTIMYLNDIADPLHFGTWGGLLTKVLWFCFGLGISSLVLTGIWITMKRKALKRKKAKKKIMGPWYYINWGLYAVIMLLMYQQLLTRYSASWTVLGMVTAGWSFFLGISWYLFVYRLNRTIFNPAAERKSAK